MTTKGKKAVATTKKLVATTKKLATCSPPEPPAAKVWPEDSKEAKLLAFLDTELEVAKEVLETFVVELLKAPGYAFEWAHGSMEKGAVIEIYSSVKATLLNEASKADFTSISEYARDRTFRLARGTRRSSSPTSDIMDDLRLNVWARLYERMGWI